MLIQGVSLLPLQEFLHNFRTLRGDFSHKTVHRWNEGIILSHISHILDVLLARTGCCRRLTDSTPA